MSEESPEIDIDEEAGTQVLEPEKKKKASQKSKRKKQPVYAVIVENDDFHTFPYVIEVLQKVCHHPHEEAYQLAKRIHFTGRAIVWTGMLETAELKRDQIKGYGPDFYAYREVRFPLGVTVEPMPG